MWESTRLITPREGGSGLPAERAVLAAVTWDVGAADDRGRRAVPRRSWRTSAPSLAAAPVDEVVVRDGLATPLADRLPAPVWLHPGRQAVFEKDGHVLAVVGEAAPAVARAYGVPGRVALAEVDLGDRARQPLRGRRGVRADPPLPGRAVRRGRGRAAADAGGRGP